jgi:hypothetical protein
MERDAVAVSHESFSKEILVKILKAPKGQSLSPEGKKGI